MKRKRPALSWLVVSVSSFVVASVLPGAEGEAQDIWARGDSSTVRLAPSQFPSLPTAVRSDLVRRGCRIPQNAESGVPQSPHNVLQGSFTKAGSTDWAVLCSVRDTSQILIYRAGGTHAGDSLARAADRAYLQRMGNVRAVAFSRKIHVVTPAYIRERHKRHGGPAPPSPIDHDGIDDGFQGKGSQVYYLHRGVWLVLQGAN